MSVLQDIKQLTPGTLVTLYCLDASNCEGKFGDTVLSNTELWSSNNYYYEGDTVKVLNGSTYTSYTAIEPHLSSSQFSTDYTKWEVFNGIFRWCDGVNELGKDVVWSGSVPGIYETEAPRKYLRFPIEAKGFDREGNGSIPRPKLTIANIGGIVGSLTSKYNDLVGARLYRVRTFLKYLDGANFSKINLLLHSNNIANSAYFINNITKGIDNTITLTSTTDPYIGQTASNINKLANRVFSFGVVASSTTAVGKYLRLFIYSNSVDEVYSTVVGPLTSTPTLYQCSYKFLTSTDTGVNFRVDMEEGSGNAWIVGDTVKLEMWQANEGIKLQNYLETTTSRNPYADPSQFLDREMWVVDRKANQNNIFIELELTAPYDLAGIKLPRRQCIQNACSWKYKSSECSYVPDGVTYKYYTITNKITTDPAKDVCNKSLAACKLRFKTAADPAPILPYGGFPMLGLT